MEEFQLWWLEFHLYLIVELNSRRLALKESPSKCTETNVIGKNNWAIHYNFYRDDDHFAFTHLWRWILKINFYFSKDSGI